MDTLWYRLLFCCDLYSLFEASDSCRERCVCVVGCVCTRSFVPTHAFMESDIDRVLGMGVDL